MATCIANHIYAGNSQLRDNQQGRNYNLNHIYWHGCTSRPSTTIPYGSTLKRVETYDNRKRLMI